MRKQRGMGLAAAVLTAGALAGCWGGAKSLHYFGDADLNYYKDAATSIDYPHVEDPIPTEVKMSEEPRTIGGRRKDELWDMSILDALHMALANNRIIRTGNQFLSPQNALYTNSDITPSIYDPAIQESGVLFGRRGVEAALADFDAQLSTNMLWGRNETVQNSSFAGAGVNPGNTLALETADFTSALDKQFAYGGSFRVAHDVSYTGTNSPAALFPSSYAGNVRAEYRQPLWAGSGTEYTRIAGPLNHNLRGITGVSQGVVIARINNDISIADFEAAVRNMLKDVEDIYWQLYLNYRLYDTAVTARNSALRSWREAKAKLDLGGAPNFKPADEAQASDQYFATEAASQTALSDIYATETRLRRILGLAVNDGRIIRPVDEPTTAQYLPEWYACLTEALMRRVELRRQKFDIKSLELQLRAANSLTRPRMDFVSAYRVNGFGDQLFGKNDNDGVTTQGLNSFYETITQGNQTGWNLGFEFSMPIGFRAALTQVRNLELRLAKSREVLATQELEISHELAIAIQNLSTQYVTAQTNFNRWRSAQHRMQLFEAEFEAGTVTLDLVLRAQASLAEAERAFYTSLVSYNRAITDLHYRKGTLLEDDNIMLAEGPWVPEAYGEAERRAVARSHAFSKPWLDTEPEEFVLPDGSTSTLKLGPPGEHGEFGEPESLNPDDGVPVERAPAPGIVSPSDVPMAPPSDTSSSGAPLPVPTP